nr:MAG TPA: dUTPase [Caudoviricetes sp.]
MNRVAKFEKVPFDEFIACYSEDLGLEMDKATDIDTIEKVYNNIQLPTRSSKHSAGYDFRSTADIILKPGKTISIPTGIRCKMNDDYVLLIYPRSSMGFKYNMTLTNTTGVIDSDYYNAKNYGHIKIEIKNNGNKDHHIELNERFAQGIFMQYGITDDDNTNTERIGGIGSTGRK